MLFKVCRKTAMAVLIVCVALLSVIDFNAVMTLPYVHTVMEVSWKKIK